MTWKEWRKFWRVERQVDIPHLSVVVMTPYAFARVLWYFCPKEFKAWPSQYETGIVIGWRWPFTKKFKEKKWAVLEDMPLAIYGAMDQTYVLRAANELGWDVEEFQKAPSRLDERQYIAATVRGIIQAQPRCEHKHWIANCPNCARKALDAAIRLTQKHLPRSVPDPREDPLTAFRRREAEAKAKMAAMLPEATE